MPDYGRPLEFGLSVVPEAANHALVDELVAAADETGLDLVGIQDHPYQARFLDTWTLIATLAARTRRVRFFPDVANLPLRPPALLAKSVASLDVLTGGRIELGIGAGWAWDAIAAFGGPRRTAGESVDALEEAIEIIRLGWSGERVVTFEGRHYSVRGWHPGPQPAHRVQIWVGAYKPRMLALTGGAADGWVPSLGHLPPADVPAAAARVDEAASAAGRDPAALQRIYNVAGLIGDGEARGVVGDVDTWVSTLSTWATELGFDTFTFWPVEPSTAQVELFAREVAPAVREAVAALRG
jgi:alkanesulfonate monooxygenase SsuD/methylene tetrahydromethanopterin reductase-like flavin-dependent oxidoreductase (luciferase family)